MRRTTIADNNEIEEEIRRQMLAERQNQVPPAPTAPYGPPGVATPPPQNPYAYPPGEPSQPRWAQVQVPASASRLERMKAKGGFGGAIAAILLFLAKVGAPILALLAKFKFLLIALKLLATGGSMLVSMYVYSKFFGWPFAVGLVVLIFIHECGHALAARTRGIRSSIMLFIPLMGAFVTLNRGGRNVVEAAFIGIMGPVFGTLGGIACVAIFYATHNPLWLELASFNFFMNLFNLAPTAPLDGGWIVPVFSPKFLAFGVIVLLILAPHNPLIWILGILSLPRVIGHWKGNPNDPYYHTTKAEKWRFGLAYLGLAAFLALMWYGLQNYLITHYPYVA